LRLTKSEAKYDARTLWTEGFDPVVAGMILTTALRMLAIPLIAFEPASIIEATANTGYDMSYLASYLC
tara:strand:+ start:813 stop:1016 length:204 start_codon:yes stop_codon:yes gene_type:complete